MSHNHDAHCCSHHGSPSTPAETPLPGWLKHWKSILSFLFLLAGMLFDYLLQPSWFSEPIRLAWYLTGYLPVAIPVLRQAWINILKGDLFTEFFLMGIATLGAFYIGEYPEGIAVMLFYSVGEAFQHGAADKARANIKALLDVRAETAHLKNGDAFETVHPGDVATGEIIRVRPGERIPLDGTLLSERSAFDTAALTGESKPRHFETGETILSGMINLNRVIELEVTKTYENSSISRILKLVEEAASRKAKTELFIRSFARVYTPAVVFLAALLVALPALFVSPYVFDDWLYRGLVFLVISCPCALVISIPLGYFGGIGAASRNGILVKGGNYLDALRSVDTVVFDKTGTLTRGVFAVQDVRIPDDEIPDILPVILAVEKGSVHPVAKALTDYCKERVEPAASTDQQQELPGRGVRAVVDGRTVLIGNRLLMEENQIRLNGASSGESSSSSLVHIAIDQTYRGSITISDQIKPDAADAIRKLKAMGIRETILLSGDRLPVAQEIARQLGIDRVYADRLPEEKAQVLDEIKAGHPGVIAYAGDGINDAPVLALSDVGIAMGAMGSDAAIETADVVIQTDQPSKIATAVQIARSTRNIVWQNIGMAMGIKAIFLGLGALGLASLWEAVFADVGVALLAILNAIRIQRIDFD